MNTLIVVIGLWAGSGAYAAARYPTRSHRWTSWLPAAAMFGPLWLPVAREQHEQDHPDAET